MRTHLEHVELEEQVLGSLIRSGERGNREIVFEAHAILQEKDAFTNGLRMAAYEAIIESAKLGAPANRHTIDNALRAKGIPAKEYLANVCETTGLSNKDSFLLACDGLTELRRKRKIHAILKAQLSNIESGTDSQKLATQAASELLRTIDSRSSTGGYIRDIVQRITLEDKTWEQRPEQFWHVSFGLPEVDALIGKGITAGQFVSVGAHTSVGKSVVAGELVRANGLHGELRPALLSLEMTEELIVKRIVSAQSSIPFQQIRDRMIEPKLKSLYNETMNWIESERGKSLWIEYAPYAPLAEIEAKIRGFVATFESRLVIVDYVQLVKVPQSYSRQVEVTEVVRTLKKLAGELGIVIFGMNQLNDDIMKRSGDRRRPFASDARESKDIEKDADVAMVIDRPAQRKDGVFWDGTPVILKDFEEKEHELMRFDFQKLRSGRTDWVQLYWDGWCQRVSPIPPDATIPSQPMLEINNDPW